MNEISARAQTREDADVASPCVGNLLDNRGLVAPAAPPRRLPLQDAGPDANYLQVISHTKEVGDGGDQSSEEESDDGGGLTGLAGCHRRRTCCKRATV